MTTAEQNKVIVTRFNKEFIEEGNVHVFNEIVSEDFINQTAPPGVPKGPEGVLYFFTQFLKPAFPDLRVVILDQVAEGDKVTTRKAFHATHKGTFFGIPASDKNVVMDVIDIVRLHNGKFVEHWNVLDWQNVVSQITGN
jgi:predicted ester cyclase